ncbi:MAG: hypothetical protein GXP54_05025 [Deltaproteobacteria bacterium]|nr:hypothetical protein [Deltaproteobacteria bacterium]
MITGQVHKVAEKEACVTFPWIKFSWIQFSWIRFSWIALAASILAAPGCSGTGDGESRDAAVGPETAQDTVTADTGAKDPGSYTDNGPVHDIDASDDVKEVQIGSEIIDGVAHDLSSEACVPNCEGVVCGGDGCGDVCGYCPYGFICKVGLCIEYCEPECEGKECGDDGCGGLCADCADNEYCSPSFTCVLKSCEPTCDVNECGPDGCGGSCGSCKDGFVCLDGRCETDTSCHDVTAVGVCDDKTLLWCQDGVLQKETCDTTNGWVCGYSQTAKKFACVIPEQCEPQCTGKECGPDLCGGQCGQCGGIEVCSTGGACGPPCGDVTEEGACQDNTLSFCHQGILLMYDCESAGKKCQWDPTGNSGQGWFDCL